MKEQLIYNFFDDDELKLLDVKQAGESL